MVPGLRYQVSDQAGVRSGLVLTLTCDHQEGDNGNFYVAGIGLKVLVVRLNRL